MNRKKRRAQEKRIKHMNRSRILWITAEKLEGTTLTISVSTRSASGTANRQSQWDYKHIYENALQGMLRGHHVQRIQLNICANGGSLESAIGLSLALADLKQEQHATVCGQCLNNATVIIAQPYLMGYVTAQPGSTISIRRVKASASAGGLMALMIRHAEKQSNKYLEKLYSKRTGKPRELIREWLDRGETMTAAQAYSRGFIDR